MNFIEDFISAKKKMFQNKYFEILNSTMVNHGWSQNFKIFILEHLKKIEGA